MSDHVASLLNSFTTCEKVSQRSTVSTPPTPIPTTLTSSSTNVFSSSPIPATLHSWLYRPRIEVCLLLVPTHMSRVRVYLLLCLQKETLPLSPPCPIYINSSFSIVFINQLIYFMNILIYHLLLFFLNANSKDRRDFFLFYLLLYPSSLEYCLIIA